LTGRNSVAGDFSIQKVMIRILLKIPVPWVFVLAYLISLLFQFNIHFPEFGDTARHCIFLSGIVLFVFGGILAAWSLLIFRRARTTTVPGKNSNKLITVGPYRFSRNPMYISLTLAYLGEAGLLVQFWPVAFLPIVLLYINLVVIPLEEKILNSDFGDIYTTYCRKVRRWM